MKLKKQIISLDFIRILSGFMIVFIHVTGVALRIEQYRGNLWWWILYGGNTLSRVSVPAFVILSGYLLLNRKKLNDNSRFYKRRLLKAGIPLFFWLFVWFFSQALGGQTLTIKYILNSVFFVNVGILYFLILILELYFLSPLLLHLVYVKKKRKKLIILVLLALFSFFAQYSSGAVFHNKFAFSRCILTLPLPYVFYFVAGGMLRKLEINSQRKKLFTAAFFILGFVTIFVANGSLRIITNTYFSPSIMGMSLSFFCLIVGSESYFQKYMDRKNKQRVRYIAETILGITIVHTYIFEFIRKEIINIHTLRFNTMGIYVAGISIVVFFISFLLVFIGKRLPIIKYLF